MIQPVTVYLKEKVYAGFGGERVMIRKDGWI